VHSSPRSNTVLCIGNEPVRLNLRCSFLKKNGWDVLSSGSSYEGVFRFGAEAVHAVILDLSDNSEEAALIAAELRRLRPDIPIIVLASEPEIMAECAANCADAVVLKSDARESLLETLEVLRNEL
jgi:CheY-like chemotaxis protein